MLAFDGSSIETHLGEDGEESPYSEQRIALTRKKLRILCSDAEEILRTPVDESLWNTSEVLAAVLSARVL